MVRAILHVDMDAFYASVEQLDHPEYRGKPVIVGANPKAGRGRGVVAACSYEARRFGVHSALPISKAWRRCPQGVFLRPRFDRYAEISEKIFAILARFTDLIEPLSIDEAFLDVTGSSRLFGAPEDIAREIKRVVRAEVGLVASVGVAPNKFVAKIASDLCKPDGLLVVEEDQVRGFLDPLPISRLWGVGPRTTERLRRYGLRTIGDVARLDSALMAPILGSEREELLLLAQGVDDRAVTPESPPKSIGAEVTFPQDTGDVDEILRTLLALSDRVSARLRRRRIAARVVVLKFRDETFTTATKSTTLPEPTDVEEEIYRAALSLLERLPWRDRKTRLVGVTATHLGPPRAQLGLFVDPNRVRKQRLASAVDDIRERFGESAIRRGALLKKGKVP
jgi:DNA polymerase-4